MSSDPVPIDTELDELIHLADLDGLIRLIDRRTAEADWAGLDRVRRHAIGATRETGRQLWPAATLAEYRLALAAPPEWVATVIDDEAGRFALGPLSEVAAVRHTWAELAPLLSPTPAATVIAHERGIRGEPIDPASLDGFPEVLDIPASLQAWEPSYSTSTYRDNDADHPEPILRHRSGFTSVDLSARETWPVPVDRSSVDPSRSSTDRDDGTPIEAVVDDVDTELAVRQLVSAWTADSSGRAEVVCVEGGPTIALAALGPRTVRLAPIDGDEALALLAWAGASSGAHGRRRGMANGRYSMWWLLAQLGDLDWPPTNREISDLLSELDWYRWDAFEPEGGWRLQVVVHNRVENTSWAINARDEG